MGDKKIENDDKGLAYICVNLLCFIYQQPYREINVRRTEVGEEAGGWRRPTVPSQWVQPYHSL